MSEFTSGYTDINRSIAGFKVHYSTGAIHTKGRKKGKEITKEEDIIIIVPSLDGGDVQDRIREYCREKRMTLLENTIRIEPFPGKRFCEFNCQYCGALSMDADNPTRRFCSEYCKSVAGHN